MYNMYNEINVMQVLLLLAYVTFLKTKPSTAVVTVDR